jgi:two-component system, probable response regulator PhcQ
MQTLYDYKKFTILYVDDEEKSLKHFRLLLSGTFRILTAANAADGFRLFEEHKDDIAILVTDQRMPGEKGVQLIEKARQLRPRVVRMLASAYSDHEATVEAVNSGAIYKYIQKPWNPEELEPAFRRAMEFFTVQRERDQLLREKLSALHNLMITDRVVSLGILAAGLGHHVRNSLVAVRTFLDLAPVKLREENVDLEALRNPNYWTEFYAQVQDQVRRIAVMLADLGAVSEARPTAFSDLISVSETINEVLGTLRGPLERKELTVENLTGDSIPKIYVDRNKFWRLFNLLIKDEIANLPAGSRLTFSAQSFPSGSAQPEEIEIIMQDNGPGLREEALRSVFDPFFLRGENPQEFGINLMTCYFIVYHHGGTVRVERGRAGGVTFRLRFPRVPKVATPALDDEDFITKILVNESLWEKLLAGG